MSRSKLLFNMAFYVFALLSLASCSKGASHHVKTVKVASKMQKLMEQAPNINPKVLSLALTAYDNASEQGIDHTSILSVVDYSMPSTTKRLWVFDLSQNKLLYNTYVAHGKNSGKLYAENFSNKNGSRKSSIGLYLTANTYIGHHGYSLRLKGLDKGYNDNAYKRSIVVHSAKYVSAQAAHKNGVIGRSWGCLALPVSITRQVIQTIKDGSLIFAYAPNFSWEMHSQFLQ